MEIDVEKLRSHLRDYYGTAVFAGMPIAALDMFKVDRCSAEDLLRIAQKEKIDLSQFAVGRRSL